MLKHIKHLFHRLWGREIDDRQQVSCKSANAVGHRMVQKFQRYFEISDRGFAKIIANINWLFLEKFLRMGLTFFVGAWVVRFLGPESFGKVSYAVAFVALFSSLSVLGLDSISIRELVENKDEVKRRKILGSTFLLKFLGSGLLFILAVAVNYLLRPGDQVNQIFVVIIAFGYLFKCLDTVDFWFQSQVESKYAALARNLAFVTVSGIKVFLILIKGPLIAFVWMQTLDFFISAVGLLYFNQKKSHYSVFSWEINLNTIKKLLTDSWPLLLSGLSIMIYMELDKIIIGNLLGNEKLGIYAAAVKISAAGYFIPTVITQSVFPAIINAKRKSKKLYLERLQKLYALVTCFSLAVAVGVSLLSKPIILLLYGSEYLTAAGVLAVHIWAFVFVSLGVTGNMYLITENLLNISFYRTLLGAISSIILNLLLVPKFGILGAAITTVISYSISAYFSNLLFADSRVVFSMLTKSPFDFLIRLYRKSAKNKL